MIDMKYFLTFAIISNIKLTDYQLLPVKLNHQLTDFSLREKYFDIVRVCVTRRSRNYHLHRLMSNGGLAAASYVTKVERTFLVLPRAYDCSIEFAYEKANEQMKKCIFRKRESDDHELDRLSKGKPRCDRSYDIKYRAIYYLYQSLCYLYFTPQPNHPYFNITKDTINIF